VLFGTIVGAGVFALPYAALQSGFFVALVWLAVLSVLMAVLHLMLGEVMLRTAARHRLPGYAAQYLGKWASKLTLTNDVIGLVGALLAYVVLGGIFLGNLFPQTLSLFSGGLLFWFVLSIPVLFGLRLIAGLELVMSGVLAVLVLALSIFLFSSFSINNLPLFSGGGNIFVPYGVILFALFGTTAVYSVRDVLSGSERSMRRAVAWGSFLPPFLYGVFIIAVVGATGAHTSKDAIAGLGAVFGYGVVAAGSVIGLLALATSYIVIARYIVDELRLDIHLSKVTSLVMLALPVALFVAGARNFIEITGAVGSVMGALGGSLILVVWLRARSRGDRTPEYTVPVPRIVAVAIVVLLIGAALQELKTLL